MTRMVHWTKWIVPGLITVAVFSFLAVRFEAAEIQADLAAKAEQRLAEEQLSWAKIALDGRDAAISGAAPTEADRERARELVSETYDIRIVSDETDLIALQAPYVLTAQKNDGQIKLEGFVPNDLTRAIIVDTAKTSFPNLEVDDQTTLARGAPDGFEKLASFAFAQLGKLSSGDVTLSGSELSIAGIANDREGYDSILALPQASETSGADIGSLDITPPPEAPYRWAVELAQGAVTASGFVASEEQRELLSQSAKRALPETEYIDNTLLASSSPVGFDERLNFAVTQLGRLDSGSVSLEDDKLQIRGQSSSLQAFDELNAAIKNLPAGVTLDQANILPPFVQPYVWQGVVAENTATISGFVPDEQARSALSNRLAELRPQLTISDGTRLAKGSPPSYGEAMAYAAERLSQLESGSVAMEGENISVSGVAKNSQTYLDAVSKKASAPPEPYRLVTNDVVAPVQSNWSWGLRYDGQVADITGFVADNSQRTEMLNNVADALPEAKLVDGLQLGSGAPENDATHRAFTIQQLRHLASAEMALEDGMLGVVGVAKSRTGYQAITKALREDRPKALTLSRVEITPPVQSPHIWSAKRDASGLTFSGDVSSESVRADVLQKAGQTFDGTMVDNMQLASGAPEQRPTDRSFALGLLAQMSSGTTTLSDQDLSVSGVAADLDAYDALQATMSQPLPAGLGLKASQIAPPTISSFRWSAEIDNMVVTLRGFVPDDATRSSLLDEGQRVFPDKGFVDRMRVAAGAASDFPDLALQSIDDLGRMSKGSVSYQDGSRRISGVAKTSGDLLFLRRKIDNDPKLNGTVMPPQAIGSYDWQATKTQTSIVLSGLVPTTADRQRIAESIASGNSSQSIVDRTLLASGEGAAHLTNVDRVVDILTGLSVGTAGVSDQKISIDGTASSVDRYDDLIAETKKWVDDATVSIGTIDIRPPAISPFTWTITETKQGVTIFGFAPTPDVAADLAAAASSQLRVTVKNDQRIAAGAPKRFARTARILIDALDRADNATASLTNGRIVLEGKASSESDALAIGERVTGLLSADYRFENRLSFPLPEPVVVVEVAPEPVTVPPEPPQSESVAPEESEVLVDEAITTPAEAVAEDTVAPPKEKAPEPVVEEVSPACPVDFQAILRGQKILFDNNRAFIKASSYPLLDKLADGFGKCSDARVEVTGHTDDVGRDAYNLALSQSRAEAVVDYIAGKGVDIDSFTAKGLGETQPIQDNTTEAGRAANRRIVIEVFPNPE